MKILSYKEREDGNLEVVTDYAPMPVFVYPADKYKNYGSLVAEMQRKIDELELRTSRRDARKKTLKDELDAALVTRE